MATTEKRTRGSKIMNLRSATPVGRTPPPARRRPPTQRRKSAGDAAVRNRPRKAHRTVLSTPKNALPGWHDLATGENERHRLRSRHSVFLETLSTARFGLLLVAVAAAFTLYVGHVHATKDLVARVAQLRQENLQLHLQYNRMKGDFDVATGPAVIYQRAGDLGLEEGIAYGPTIRVVAP